MDFELTEQQVAIDEGVRRVCAGFDDAYWTECDENAKSPKEYYRAMADGGWLGMTMPEQKARWLKPLIEGKQKACFGVTEPDAGLDTTSLTTSPARTNSGYRLNGRKMWTSTGQVADKILLLTRTTPKAECKRPTDGMTLFYTDLDRSKIEVRRICKMGRNAVDSNAVFIDDLFLPDKDRVGEEGKGFKYILDSLNPKRVLVASEAIGVGRDALRYSVRQRPRRVRPANWAEPGHPAPLGRVLGAAGVRFLDGAAGGVAIRRRPAAWRRRGERRQAAGRPRRVLNGDAGGDGAWRHGICAGVSGG